MKTPLNLRLSFLFGVLCALALAISAPAQTAGQFLFPSFNTSGPATPHYVTPENNKAFGINGSGVPAMLSISGGSSTLAGLSDVSITSLASGDMLKYNGSAWINRTAANVRSDLGLGSLATLSAITSSLITDGEIVNADIAANAAIALSKLATDPLARANHTGTQAISTITDLQTTLDGLQPLHARLTGLTTLTPDAEHDSVITLSTAGGVQASTELTIQKIILANTNASGVGVIWQDAYPLAHTFTPEGGLQNLWLGLGAGNFTSTGNGGNVAIGALAAANTSTGYDNLAIGYVALGGVNSGYRNTAIGRGSLFQLTSGNNNIGIGYAAGYNLTTTSNNICIGNLGTLGDSGVIRIGTTGTHSTAYIAGTLNATLASGSVTNAMLANSAITINGSAVSLGGSTTISTGLTIDSTAITSGTAGRLLFESATNKVSNDADLTFSTDTLTATKIVGSTNLTIGGGSALTSSGAGGTVFTTTTALGSSQLGANTWTGAQSLPAGSVSATSLNFGTAGTGIYSSSATNSIDFAVGGTRRWQIDSSGTLQGGSSSLQLTGNTLGTYFFARGGYYAMGASDDVVWQRIAANHGAFARSTNPQSMSVANTFTNTTNYEALTIDWSSNVARIKPTAAGTGTVRTVRYYLTDTVWIGVGSGSPEGVETAGVGSTYHRTDGGTGTSHYFKESGTGNTGWIAK